MSDPREWSESDWQTFDDTYPTEDVAVEAHNAITQIVYDTTENNWNNTVGENTNIQGDPLN
jgi:hypothetical protein